MNVSNILEELGISIYIREGKYYWTIKSKAFDSLGDALDNIEKMIEKYNSQNLQRL